MWTTNITDEIENDLGEEWSKHLDKSYAYYGQPGGLQKNKLAISRALKSAWDDDKRSTSLNKLINHIIAFASS